MIAPMLALILLSGCISSVYRPGEADNPLSQLRLGQSYGDMVRVLGAPDHGQSEDRKTEEMIALIVPVWNIAEAIGNFNPSSIQIYTYTRFGRVTIGDGNKIIRIEAFQTKPTS